MTHDELLAELNKDIDQTPLVKDYYPIKALFALRAVVELHKPHHGMGGTVDTDGVCLQCSGRKFEQFYPCPTIQKIMDELK